MASKKRTTSKRASTKRATVKRASTKRATSSRRTATAATAKKKVGAKTVALGILEHAYPAEMKVQDLITQTLADKRVHLAGKTPRATLAAAIYIECTKPDGRAEKRAPGVVCFRSPRQRAAANN